MLHILHMVNIEYYMHVCIFIIFVHIMHIMHIMTFLFRLQVTMMIWSYSNQQLILTCLMRTLEEILITSFH